MQIIKPNSEIQEPDFRTTIFLAGSIEMGVAEDWQSLLEKKLSEYEVTIFNPLIVTGILHGNKINQILSLITRLIGDESSQKGDVS